MFPSAGGGGDAPLYLEEGGVFVPCLPPSNYFLFRKKLCDKYASASLLLKVHNKTYLTMKQTFTRVAFIESGGPLIASNDTANCPY